MECTNEAQDQNSVVQLDGRGCIVGGALCETCGVNIAHNVNSTGSCCIVRTVLNFEAVPIDLTCKLPLSRIIVL